MPPVDGELIQKIKQNESLAFDQLFLNYKDQVYRFTLCLAQNNKEAGDLFQET